MMNVSTPVQNNTELSGVDALLKRAEQTIMLIDRATAKDGAVELGRVIEAWRKGRKLAPAFAYGPAPELGELCAELSAVSERLSGKGALLDLYAERARELELEARMVQNLG